MFRVKPNQSQNDCVLLTNPELITRVNDSKASQFEGWNKTDFEFLR